MAAFDHRDGTRPLVRGGGIWNEAVVFEELMIFGFTSLTHILTTIPGEVYVLNFLMKDTTELSAYQKELVDSK